MELCAVPEKLVILRLLVTWTFEPRYQDADLAQGTTQKLTASLQLLRRFDFFCGVPLACNPNS